MLHAYRNTISLRIHNRLPEMIGEYPNEQIALMDISLNQRQDEPYPESARRYDVYALASPLPAWEEAKRKSDEAWAKVDESDIFMAEEEEAMLFGRR